MKLFSSLTSRASRLSCIACVVLACGGGDETPMDKDVPLTDALPMNCDPLYPPDFETIYLTTVQPKCALGPCHSVENAQGGIDLSSRDKTWMHWLDEGRVVPGRPSHSVLIQRLQLDDKSRRMPPGDGLESSEICAITQWIYDGAKR